MSVSYAHLARDYVFAPGLWFALDYDKIHEDWDGRCYLVALDEYQIDFLLNLTSAIPNFYKNWGYTKQNLDKEKWKTIQEFVSLTETCLMSGCDVQLMVKTQLMLVAALTGDSVDLDADIETLISGVKDYADNGVSPQFVTPGGDNIAEVTDAMSTQQNIDLVAIKDALAALTSEMSNVISAIEAGQDLEDDLANVWNAISAVVTVLGGTVGIPPLPL